MDIAELGIRARSDTLAPATKDLKELQLQAAKTEAATEKMAAASNVAATNVATAGRAAQRTSGLMAGSSQGIRNLGLQLNQVAQQGAVTGNYLQALTIQLPDLLLGFGTFGIAVSLAAGALSPFALSLLDAGDKTKTFEENLEDLQDVTEGLKEPMDILALTAEELGEKYGEAADRVREFAVIQAELRIAQAESRLAESVAIITQVGEAYEAANDDAREYGRTIQGIQADFGVTRDQAKILEDALTDMMDASTFEGQVSALERITDLISEAGIDAANIPPEFRSALLEMISFSNETDAARALVEQLRDVAIDFGSTNLSRPIDIAKASAEELADALGIAFIIAQGIGSISGPNAPVLGTLEGVFGEFGSLFSDRGSAPVDETGAGGGSAGRSGGGASRADTFEAELERLRKNLRTEQEVVQEWYEQSQELLADQRAEEILGIDEHNQARLRLEQEYQEQLNEIRSSQQGKTLKEASTFFSAMASVTAHGGESMVKATRTFAAAAALINTYKAASDVLADPSLGFLGKMAAYATVLSAGLGLVSAIKGGGAGGTSGGATTASSQVNSANQQEPQRIIFQGLDDSALFTGAMLRDLFESVLDENNRRGGVLVVNA